MPFLFLSRMGTITKLRMRIVHFLTRKDIKMSYREEIIQSDSPLGDMFPRFRFCAPRIVPKHLREGKMAKDTHCKCLNYLKKHDVRHVVVSFAG